MYHFGDYVATEYGIGIIVGNFQRKIIVQFNDPKDLPEFILENKHGVGYWLYLPEETELEVIKKKA